MLSAAAKLLQSWLVVTFLPRSKRLLISWMQSPSAVILEPMKRKSVTTSNFFLSICHAVMGEDVMILVLFCFVCFGFFSLKPDLSLSSFSLIKRLFSSSSISAIKVVSSGYLRLLFLLENLILACEERTEVKGKGKRERYTQLKAEFQRIARRD